MSIYAKSKIAFCFTTFIVLQAVRYASFSKNVSICHVRLRKSRRRKPRFRIIYRFHRRTPRLSRLPNLWRIISLQTGQKMHGQEVQEVTLKEGTPSASRRPVRPLPDVDYFFENQWRIYRERMGMMD